MELLLVFLISIAVISIMASSFAKLYNKTRTALDKKSIEFFTDKLDLLCYLEENSRIKIKGSFSKSYDIKYEDGNIKWYRGSELIYEKKFCFEISKHIEKGSKIYIFSK